MLELESRHHALRAEELDDLRVSARHHQFIRCVAEYETDQTIRTVGRAPTDAVIAAD